MFVGAQGVLAGLFRCVVVVEKGVDSVANFCHSFLFPGGSLL